jgi:hypothetical protein
MSNTLKVGIATTLDSFANLFAPIPFASHTRFVMSITSDRFGRDEIGGLRFSTMRLDSAGLTSELRLSRDYCDRPNAAFRKAAAIELRIEIGECIRHSVYIPFPLSQQPRLKLSDWLVSVRL